MNKSLGILARFIMGAIIILGIFNWQTGSGKYEQQQIVLQQQSGPYVDSIKNDLRGCSLPFDSLLKQRSDMVRYALRIQRENDSLKAELETCKKSRVIRHAENVFIGQ